jgi:hypothetical protein
MRVAPGVKEVRKQKHCIIAHSLLSHSSNKNRDQKTRNRETNKHIGRMKYSPHRASSRQFHALQEALKSGVAAHGISPGFDLKEGDAVGPHFITPCSGRQKPDLFAQGGMDNRVPPATP